MEPAGIGYVGNAIVTFNQLSACIANPNIIQVFHKSFPRMFLDKPIEGNWGHS